MTLIASQLNLVKIRYVYNILRRIIVIYRRNASIYNSTFHCSFPWCAPDDPPVGSTILMSGKTSLVSVAVHAAIFYLVAKYVLPELTSRQVLGFEGFQDSSATKKESGKPCADNLECESGKCSNNDGTFLCD